MLLAGCPPRPRRRDPTENGFAMRRGRTSHPTPRLSRDDESMTTARYREIANQVRDLIEHGELNPGDKILSTRALAGRYGVARATAGKALDTLRREGLVESRHGSGTYVGRPSSRVVLRVTLTADGTVDVWHDPGHPADELRAVLWMVADGFEPGASQRPARADHDKQNA